MEDIAAILGKMTPESRSILQRHLSKKTKSVRFFSYGSNMNEEKFEKDMKGKIGMINKTTVRLLDFNRTLSNYSEKHGVAFSIQHSPGDEVEGICHDVPIELLEDFLKKEGVLKTDVPTYRMMELAIPNQNEPILTLQGLRPFSLDDLSSEKARLALDYVNQSIQGAECCDVEHGDMTEMKKKLEDIIKTKEKQG